MSENENIKKTFVHKIVDEHNENGRFDKKVITRFPPEPNGYLHIGHAKSICLNFGLAEEYGGYTNLRFDDTNPAKEKQEYIDAIKRDVEWLGFKWENELYASDYFDTLYAWAVNLIKQGKAYIDDLSADEIREYRGSLTAPGKDSPYRERSVEENLALFEGMKNGEFDEGSRVLRMKGDMASGNITMRDSIMYRIVKAEHPRTGDKWVIYPTYDWAHGASDSIEGITHSICTLEFENHRPLYEWYLMNLEEHLPQQIEFAELNITHTVMSKRRMVRLVEGGYVNGWDDPRMPSIAGLRRRGVRPEAIRAFADRIGVAKANSTIEVELLEATIREDLDPIVPRMMAVLRPLKMVITNFPEDKEEWFEVDMYRHDKEKEVTRKVPLTREVYIEQGDFMEEPAPKFFRLFPGKEVRLMGACLVTCTDVVKDEAGNISEVHVTYDPDSIGGMPKDGRKVKGTLHWVSAKYAVDAEARLYGHLFSKNDPYEVEEDQDWIENINPDSVEVLEIKVEPAIKEVKEDRFQFMRNAFFYVDPVDSTEDKLVFNRIVELRSSWKPKQK